MDQSPHTEPKTVLVATDTWTQVNGITTLYRAVLSTLDRELWGQCAVVVVYPSATPTVESIGDQHRAIGIVPRVRFRVPFYRDLLTGYISAKQFADIDRDWGPFDVVHVATQGLVGLSAGQWARARLKRCTGFYHTNWPAYLAHYLPLPLPRDIRRKAALRIGQWWDKRIYRACDDIVVHTKRSEQALKAYLPARFTRAAGFVEVNRFRARGLRDVPKDTSGPRQFGFVGRLAREKQLVRLVACAPIIGKLGGQLHIVGDGPERAALTSCEKAIVFHGWKKPEELVGIYRELHFLLLPTDTDTLGLVLLEASACGTPVVALSDTVAADFVKQYENGVITDAFSDELMKHLANLIKTPQYERMCSNAKRLAKEHNISQGTLALARIWTKPWRKRAA